MKKIIVFVLFFLLMHFENYSIGPVKISIIWKLILLPILIIYNYKTPKRRDILRYEKIYRPLFYLSLLSLFSFFYDPESALRYSSLFLLFYHLGVYTLGLKLATLIKYINFFKTFFIICFVPYFFGLESKGQVYDLEKYGGGMGVSGPFANPHTASMILAITSLICLFVFINSKKKKERYWNMGLFALSIFFLVNTFVRTGLAMFVIGALPILIKKINMKYVVSGVFLIGLIAYGLSSFVDSDSVFYKRLIGKSRHNEEKTFEQAGSGRGLLFLTGLDIIKSNDSALYMIFGLGEANLKKEIKKRTGNLIVTHNGFLDLLLITGLLGFALFLYFLIKNIGIIRKSNSKLLRGLGMSIYFTIVVMVFFQDFKRIYPFLFLIIINSIIIQLLNDSNKKIDSFKEIVSGIKMANA